MTPANQSLCARALLAFGQACLRDGDAAGASQALALARSQPETCLAAHRLIEEHRLSDAFSNWTGVNCTISEADDIFRFFQNHPTSSNPLRDYFADGWRTLSELLLLLERNGKTLTGCGSFLEFASGHGRFTRHLVNAVPPQRITVSDVVPDAVSFSTQTFGVEGFVATNDPAQLNWPAQWDIIFVLSLFSHLPEARWGHWLAHLYDALSPGGLLIFTTHGVTALEKQHVELDASGFRFFSSSESQAIDTQEYGTTFTSDDYVRERIQTLLPGAVILDHAPACFWSHQDAWVVARPASH